MKCYKFLIISFLLTLFLIVILCKFGCSFDEKVGDSQSENPNIITIADNVFLEKSNSYRHNMYVGKASSDEKVLYIEESLSNKNLYIYKFSILDGKLAYHLNELKDSTDEKGIFRKCAGASYEIIRDEFVIYDISSNERLSFSSEDEFNSYCTANELSFNEWTYSNGLEYKETELTDSCKLVSSESISVTEQLVCNNKVVLEGFISDLKQVGDYLVFRIEIPSRELLEFPDRYYDLFADEKKSVGKHQIGLLLYEEIYFDKYVVFDSLSSDIEFFDDFDSAEQLYG